MSWSLADGGEHRVHHAENPADRHHDCEKADCPGELGGCFGEALVVFGFNLGADGGLFVFLLRNSFNFLAEAASSVRSTNVV